MKLEAFKATKKPVLNPDHHQINQNTFTTSAKKIAQSDRFFVGGHLIFYDNCYIIVE